MNKLVRQGAIFAIIFFLIYCLLETGSYLFLRSVTTVSQSEWGIEENLTKHFPAQFTMTREEILREFPKISIMERTGQFLTFDFDPVLGFRRLEFLRWYGGSPDDISDKFLIVTFGGSTTQLDNWPQYLLEAAGESGVREDIMVLNAGLAGYMTFNEKLFFSSWVLPMLAEKGKQPDLVLSLDGVNDIWYRIFAYYEAMRDRDTQWYNQYHGVHQKYETDMKEIGTVGGAFRQFAAGIIDAARVRAQLTMPYTMRTIVYLMRRNMTASADDKNPPVKRPVEMLPLDVRQKIISAYGDSLTDFYGLAAIRKIDFVAYLQPVVLKKYYPHDLQPDFAYKGINEMGIKEFDANGSFTRLPVNRLIETEPLYGAAETLYWQLDQRYPGHFANLIGLFRANPEAAKLYKSDAIHYERLGKKTIARAVIADLVAKGKLSATGTSGQAGHFSSDR